MFPISASCSAPASVAFFVTLVCSALELPARGANTCSLARPAAPLGPPAAQAGAGCQPHWIPTFGGPSAVSGYVRGLASFDDGSGPGLYAGGVFANAGGVTVNDIARWDGASWSALGGGVSGGAVTGGGVQVLTVFDDGSGPSLYAGGGFTSAGSGFASRVAKWDGTSWSALGAGVQGGTASGWGNTVFSLAGFDDGSGPALFAGGNFTNSGGAVVCMRMGKWNGTSWSGVGGGMSGNSTSCAVHCLAVFDGGTGPALFAGGVFFSAGGVPASNIAKWDGTSWSAVGGGIDLAVYALTVFDDGSGPALIAGGTFLSAGGVPANNIAKWDGTSWTALGSGTNASVGALTVFDDGSGQALYAGGGFTSAGAVAANRMAKWDGTSWSALGSGMSGQVAALMEFHTGVDSALYAGGSFGSALDSGDSYLAKWGCPPLGTGAAFCNPGLAGVIGCPCANPPAGSGRGCDNSAATGGASIAVTGAATIANDTLVFATAGETPTATSIVVAGDAAIASGVVFGQGVRCVGGVLRRLYVAIAAGGGISAPSGSDPSVSGRHAALGDLLVAGDYRYYMVYYRDPAVLGGCAAASTFNATNAVEIGWAP